MPLSGIGTHRDLESLLQCRVLEFENLGGRSCGSIAPRFEVSIVPGLLGIEEELENELKG